MMKQKTFNITFNYGNGDINEIVDKLAKRVIEKSVNEFNSGRHKKITSYGHACELRKREIA